MTYELEMHVSNVISYLDFRKLDHLRKITRVIAFQTILYIKVVLLIPHLETQPDLELDYLIEKKSINIKKMLGPFIRDKYVATYIRWGLH